jgi:hypothetical protein
MQIELDANSEWYTKYCVARALRTLDQEATEGQELLDSGTVPGSLQGALRHMIAHNEQLIREIRQYVPEALQSDEL